VSAVSNSFVQSISIDLERIRSLANSDDVKLYAMLDACDEPSVPVFAAKLKDRAASLYRGNAEQEQAKSAPYIAVVDGVVFDWIHENLWGKPWGFFASSRIDLLALRTHFRRFLIVEGAEAKELYFRFYDPRVLEPFLASADAAKLARFFGPVEEMQIVNADLEVLAFQPFSKSTPPTSNSQKIMFSNSDMEAYANARRAIFAKRLFTQIAGKLKDLGRTIDHQVLAEQVDQGIRRALTYEMNAQCDIARYVETMCIHVKGFVGDRDLIPIQDILLDRRVDWSERLDRFDAHAMSSLAATAEAN
jgi:hypothetical protein